MDKNLLSKTLIAGAGLALVGVGLFAGLWVLLGSLELDNFLRLFLALCIPPAFIALIVGSYLIITRRRE